jgi:hypothetical protein
MKLIFIAAPFLNAIRVSRQTSTIINSIKDVVDYNGNDVSTMQNHGCHCGVLSDDAFTSVGTPFDQRDRFCRSWQSARNCVALSQGACDGVSDISYTGSDFDAGCAGLSNCKKAICDIDVAFHAAVFDEATTLNTAATCTAGSGVLTAKDTCCGSSPFEYYTAESQCGDSVTSTVVTGLFKYHNADIYFADELSPSIPDPSTENGGYSGMWKLYDGNHGTGTICNSENGEGINNHLFMYWPSIGSVSITLVTYYGNLYRLNRNEFIEVRCLKSGGYSVCAKEDNYDAAATRDRGRALPFHCYDDCVGLEFHNSGTGDASITTIVELDIGIECPDNTQPDSNNYCLTV